MTHPRWGVGSNQYQKRAGSGAQGRPETDLSLDAPPSAQPTGVELTPALIKSRNHLLDALTVLAPHAEALTVIGAQAVHERTDPDLPIPSTSTEDGDLAVTPELLVAQPQMGTLLGEHGYQPKFPERPGIWVKADHPEASVDLLVPESVAGPGRRSAKTFHNQGRNVIGRAAGIEMAMTDRNLVTLVSLDGSRPDVPAYVAGTAALLCAKSYKITERIEARDRGKLDRVKPKDAGDMWRLMASSDPTTVRETFRRCEADPKIGPSARIGRAYFESLFSPTGEGHDLILRDLGPLLDEESTRMHIENWMASFAGELD